MSYYFTPSALRQLKKLPLEIQHRIIKKLDFYCAQSEPLQFAENLVKFEIGSYRFRVGDYRVIFDIEDDNLLILLVGHRRNIYQ